MGNMPLTLLRCVYECFCWTSDFSSITMNEVRKACRSESFLQQGSKVKRNHNLRTFHLSNCVTDPAVYHESNAHDLKLFSTCYQALHMLKIPRWNSYIFKDFQHLNETYLLSCHRILQLMNLSRLLTWLKNVQLQRRYYHNNNGHKLIWLRLEPGRR